MTQIAGSGRIAELIIAQLGALQRVGIGERRDRPATPGKTHSPASDVAQARDVISPWVEEQVRKLTAEDPERERKAFRIFLESVFLKEFGTRLLDDPGFEKLVDRVQQQMEADPEVSRAMRQAGSILLASALPGNVAG